MNNEQLEKKSSLQSNIFMNIIDNMYQDYPPIKLQDMLLGEIFLLQHILSLQGRGIWDKLCHKINYRDLRIILEQCEAGVERIHRSEFLFSILSTDFGRKRLIDSFSSSFAGFHYINLIPNYVKRIKEWKHLFQNHKIENKDNSIEYKTKLTVYDLSFFGFPIKLYSNDIEELIPLYGFQQYRCIDVDLPITVEPGDIVLDCGGFVGDSALLFSSLTTNAGQVYSFEFYPPNLKMFQNNLDINPVLAKNITVVPYPLDKTTGRKMYYNNDGENHDLKAAIQIKDTGDQAVETLSIDDFVKQRNLKKVDFIKMDIEGAELVTLQGAEETLRTFKPKLAISLYHKPEDMYEIPKFLYNLNVGYRFSFDQFHLEGPEKILFAKV